ncbi:integrase arm-type DNA-binding domain-containing protein [Gammaproteobacteria bacterium]|nr:integrase arm-type DNA-binding domain-containing protein [Gammaproteobacteria bacterium]
MDNSTINQAICEVKQARKARKIAAGHSVHLYIQPTGTSSWRLKYRLPLADGRRIEKSFTIGQWPEINHETALALAADAKQLISKGRDPVAHRRVQQLEALTNHTTTLAQLVDDWLGRMKLTWSAVHYKKSSRALERDILPALGVLPVPDISTRMIAQVIANVEARGSTETARRILQHLRSVFDLAQAKGIRLDNPVIAINALVSTTKRNRRPAITDITELGGILRKLDVITVNPAAREAIYLLAHTGVRLGELLPAAWSEFQLDGDNPRWAIPRKRMKAKDRPHDHAVPLSPQIVARLKAWKNITGGTGYVFRSPVNPDRHLTIEAIEKTHRNTLGLRDRHVPHGWRSAFSTNANDAVDCEDRELFDTAVIEVALDHLHGSSVQLRYDRGKRWTARRRLMRWWSQQLDEATEGAVVLQISVAN